MATKRKTRKTAAVSPQAKLLEAMQQVWLAGLGAMVKTQRGAPQLFEELVAEGTRMQRERAGEAEKAVRGLLKGVQSTIDARVGEVRTRTADALDGLEKIFQTRVHRALAQLGVPSAEELAALSKRVDALTGSINKLARKSARARTGQPVKKEEPAAPTH